VTNQAGIGAFLDKLKLQIETFQQVFKVASRSQVQPHAKVTQESLEQHPELPLEIGSELLITAELVKTYHSLSKSIGRVVIIDQISTKERTAVKASAFGIQVDVDLKVAQQMREAFLQRNQALS
jgi:hypothetical protein